jgi:hypothetical protein
MTVYWMLFKNVWFKLDILKRKHNLFYNSIHFSLVREFTTLALLQFLHILVYILSDACKGWTVADGIRPHEKLIKWFLQKKIK